VVRILVDPNDPAELKQVHALQDAIKVEQRGRRGKSEVPNRALPASAGVMQVARPH
jgi:hypothetical protein